MTTTTNTTTRRAAIERVRAYLDALAAFRAISPSVAGVSASMSYGGKSGTLTAEDVALLLSEFDALQAKEK